MKKLKILLISLAGLAVVSALAVVIAIKVFFPEDKIKTLVADYAKNNLNREVSFDSLSLKFIGINLKNFKMSEKATFNEGTFIKSDNFIMKISPLPLLKKNIKISNILLDSININITKDENGLFNFDDIIKSFQNSETSNTQTQSNPERKSTNNEKPSNSFILSINNFDIKNANIIYTDKKTNLEASIKNLNLSTDDFSFTEMFDCETSFDLAVKQNKLDIALPLSAKFKTDLNNFDMDKLFFELETLETNFNNATISLQGKIENLNTPKIDCNLILKNIDDKTFKDFFTSKTEFKADEITFKTKSVINISSMNADIESLNLVLPNSSSDISGTINWGKQDIEYNVKLNLDLLIDNFAKAVPEYNLTGRLKTNIEATQNFCKGNFILENISSKSQYGTLSNLNTEFYLEAKNKTPLHKADFKTLNIDSLSFIIKKLSLKYNEADISLTGNITKQLKSSLNLNLKSKNITNDTFKKFYTCPVKFILPSLDIDTILSFNLNSKSADITKLNIKLPDSFANITGLLNWKNEKNFVYDLALNLNLLLDNIEKKFPEYKMKGKILSKAKLSNNDFSGTLSCANLTFDYLPVASVSKLNLEATAKSKKNIVIKFANGTFNDGKFEASGSLINKDIKLNLTMDKLKIVTSTQTTTKQQPKKEEPKKTSSSAQPFNYNIYTDISINEINIPYLSTKKATLKTSLKSVTDTMKKTNGTFALNVSTGTISNINELTKNKFAKTFLPLFNIINNNRTEETKGNGKNDISFQNIICDVLFTDGIIKTNNLSIKIPTAKIIAKGTIDLKTEALNLAVSAGNYTGIKIKGTLSEPKISYDVAAAISNVLGEKGVGDTLKNLFKTNKKEEQKQEPVQETKQEPVQEVKQEETNIQETVKEEPKQETVQEIPQETKQEESKSEENSDNN